MFDKKKILALGLAGLMLVTVAGCSKKQAAPQVAFVFLGPLTNEPPAPAGNRARQRGGRESMI